MTDPYAPCRNCGARFSAAAAVGSDGTMSERVRSHEAGCPGDVPVSPPAGRRPTADFDRLRRGFQIVTDDRMPPDAWMLVDPLSGRPYGVKTNGVQP